MQAILIDKDNNVLSVLGVPDGQSCFYVGSDDYKLVTGEFDVDESRYDQYAYNPETQEFDSTVDEQQGQEEA